MNKLYIEEIEKQNKNEEEEDEDENNQVKDNNNNENLVIKKNYSFTPEMKKFFSDLYFNDLDFGSNDKFAFYANKKIPLRSPNDFIFLGDELHLYREIPHIGNFYSYKNDK